MQLEMEDRKFILLQISISGPVGSNSINTSSFCAIEAISPTVENTAAYRFHRAALASSLSRSCHQSLSLLLTSSSDMSILLPLLLSRYFFWGFPSSSSVEPLIVVNLSWNPSPLFCLADVLSEDSTSMKLLPFLGFFFEGERTALRLSSLLILLLPASVLDILRGDPSPSSFTLTLRTPSRSTPCASSPTSPVPIRPSSS
mmetsp:Transcript_52327/g.130282  ORF Transcript_52327/g.130282 Transcript_52327/m.130282 type:complete len:200 (-) Transcript_52327:37-636(-)